MTIASLPTLSVRDVPLATATQMAEADRVASQELGIPLEVLMENAARQIAIATRLFVGGIAGKDVVAVVGSGNNGGDALGALRHLAAWGARAEAYVGASRESSVRSRRSSTTSSRSSASRSTTRHASVTAR